ncbi:hypothetical protein A1O7_02657 [Cladophialophora yegresii CBS 114405]|uniref:Uncharacterized protein n=1 Tax=Cladophialophora yegresii CBS 114405 TaxID=1182544 RepID=W9WV88_9EURO|nr:uncharacterized protein A1O7_02657 [Cladophialophora yegresii CBS 114405]EXJ62224.1 hypothetical protein A1O7_02657 [Cladophialophora yegresii CBS 114405]
MSSATSRPQYASVKTDETQPEYAKYKSMEQFFNHRRLQLQQKTPTHFHFHAGVKPGTPGHRALSFPASPPRALLSPEEAAAEKKRRVSKKYLTILNPGWCLRRRQLVEMWNKDIHMRRQLRDQRRASSKMKALAKEFRLSEVVNEDTKSVVQQRR